MSNDFSYGESFTVKAKKRHLCKECASPIAVGETYLFQRSAGKYHGEFRPMVLRVHINCTPWYVLEELKCSNE